MNFLFLLVELICLVTMEFSKTQFGERHVALVILV